jgi:tetratricopeptide (TPR) repeat protein
MMSLNKVLIYTCLAVVLLSCNNKAKNGRIPEVDPELMHSGEPELNALNASIAEDPDNAQFYYKRAKIYYQTGLNASALTDLNTSIHLDSTYSDFYVLLSKVYYKMHRVHPALKTAIIAEELNSNDPELFILMSQLFIDLGNQSKSEYYFNKASAMAPFHSDIFVLKGKMAALKGDTALAVPNLLSAIQKDPRNIDSYKELVKIYDAKKKYDSTLMFLIKGRAVNYREPAFYFYEGKFFENVNFQKSAKTSYETAFKFDSSYFPAQYKLGLLNLKEEDFRTALQNFVNVVKFEPYHKEANLHAAELYEQLNSADLSIPYYQRVLLKDTSNVKAKESLERLYKIYPDKRKVSAPKDTVKAIPLNVDTVKAKQEGKPALEIKKEAEKKPIVPKVPKKDTVKLKKAPEVIKESTEIKKEEVIKEEPAAPVNNNQAPVGNSDTSAAKKVKKKKIKKDTIQ